MHISDKMSQHFFFVDILIGNHPLGLLEHSGKKNKKVRCYEQPPLTHCKLRQLGLTNQIIVKFDSKLI